ncbi:MAG: PucR family transcriptional regulator [Candidatus Scatomorpha sp.]|jgi:hypothetical protein
MTVGDVMKLPCMVGAEVVAGKAGLNYPVESVNVLEYGWPTEVLNRFFRDNTFDGNELLISALSSIADDVDAQCENIRRYHSVGAVGLVLYYVGIIIPEIDKRLLEQCDELDFPLICMPPWQTNLRYSETIREVLFEVYREQQREQFFVSTLLDRISGLPAQQRSMETMLKMLSEHLRVSVILTEQRRELNTVVFWPRSLGTVIADQLPGWLKELGSGSKCKVPLGDGEGYLQSCPYLMGDSDNLRLFILKYREPLPEDTLWQASECVRLFIHIWNKNHGKFVISELVRAIINDEPVHKQRLAQMFRVRIQDLNQMWLFIPKQEQAGHDEQLLRGCTDYFSAFSDPVLVSYYEETLVVFIHCNQNGKLGEGELFGSREQYDSISRRYEIVCCDCLNDSSDARQAYLVSMAQWRNARRIYPRAGVLRTEDMMFSQLCQEIMASRENLGQYLRILSGLRNANAELITTMTTYLLDAGSSMAETARLLYVHLNTVKYRLRQVQELTGFSPTQLPGAYSLYIAAAINRISGEDP